MEPAIATATALTARTIHIKLYPTPQTFPERREVLRVLESFGEVTFFRSLKYNRPHQNPVRNAFLALFATKSAADDALRASPIRYQLTAESSSNPHSSETEPESPGEPLLKSETEQRRTKTINCEMSINTTTFDHNLHLTSGSRNPLHGPFKPAYFKNSYISSSLHKNIPESLWSAGMLDWETDKGIDATDGSQDGARFSSAGDAGERNFAGLGKWEKTARERRERPRVMRGLRDMSRS